MEVVVLVTELDGEGVLIDTHAAHFAAVPGDDSNQ